MGKFYGLTPSDYFEIEDNQNLNLAVDLACMLGYFEDENYHYKQSQETAQNEAVSIGQVLEQERERLDGRG